MRLRDVVGIRSRKGILYLPSISIVGVVFILLVLIVLSTYRNYEKERTRMEAFLLAQGVALIQGLEAGARTGMMRMKWGNEWLQALVEEVFQRAGLLELVIFDREGRILAHSDLRKVGGLIEDMGRYEDLFTRTEARRWVEGDRFVVGKAFIPLRPGPMMWHRMRPWFGHMMGSRGRGNGTHFTGRAVLVSLSMEPFLEAQREDIRHAILMGVILLVVSSAALYFVFLVQNYYLVRRTLRNMATYTSHVVEKMPNGLISVDPQGRIVTFNRMAAEVLGTRPAEREDIDRCLGKPWARLWQKVVQGEAVLEEEMVWDGPEGPVPLAVSASRMMDQEEDLGCVFIFRDLREIRALEEQVKRSERLAAIGRLASGIAHEIRNPLSSIKGFAQLFQRRFQEGSEERGYAKIMVQEVNRLNRVITDLLDFARPKEPHLKRADLEALARHAISLVSADMKCKGIDLSLEVKGEIPPCALDRDQITQVLLNLLLNALEAIDGSGEVYLRLFPPRRGENMVNLEIEDKGRGISQVDVSRIFDPFFTTKRKGTGLGLAIAHRIIENHGGSIRVKSQPGRGTTFYLKLPVWKGEEDGETYGPGSGR